MISLFLNIIILKRKVRIKRLNAAFGIRFLFIRAYILACNFLFYLKNWVLMGKSGNYG